MTFRRFVFKGAIFVVLVFVVDRLVFFAFDTVYPIAAERGGAGSGGEGIVYSTLDAKADVVVLGHSRARLDYDTRVLSDGLGVSVYNAGKNGQGLWYARAMIDLIEQTYTPKLYIIETDPATLVFTRRQRERISFLAPFMDRSAVVRRMILTKSPLEPLKYTLKSMRYNSKCLQIANNLVNPDPTINGFMPMHTTHDPDHPDADDTVPYGPIDPGIVALLHETLAAAQEHGASVVMVSSPLYRDDPLAPWKFDPMVTEIWQIGDDEGVAFIVIDPGTEPAFRDPSVFGNPSHLNTKGAKIFTKLVVDRIEALMDEGALPPFGSRSSG